tara:strand:+ start:212 stop:898 length:687 start_codon:yes stop_codon:yes gene_type:complete
VTSDYCITCIKIGDKFDAQYVNKLYNMVRLQTDAPFYCFTDDASDINSEVNVIPIDVTEYLTWENWWAAWWKIQMFVHPDISSYERKIFFDLDVIIHGDITEVLDHDAEFALVYSTWKGVPFKMRNPRKSLYNSSVIVWRDATRVYEYFMQSPREFVAKYAGTDDFYHNEKVKRTQLPHCIYSYRDGESPNQLNSFTLRANKSIALLHQYPKNHELDEQVHPIVKYWV